MMSSGPSIASTAGEELEPGRRPGAVLAVHEVSKRFGPVQALKEVSIDCLAGETHAVLGENGSGKSTLLGIASGVLGPDAGHVWIGGHEIAQADAAAARAQGLAMAYQTYSLIPELTVAQNLFLSAPPVARPAHRDAVAWARAELERFDVELEPTETVDALRLAQRQFLEVVKALVGHPRILLLDEPTTALGPAEVEQLHALVLGEVERGMGVLYVSHRLPEVLTVADRVTVLRDGHVAGSLLASEAHEDHLISLMIGRSVEQAFPQRSVERLDQALVEITALEGKRFGPVTLTLAPGEIVGLAGAEGNGQDGFVRAVAGAGSDRDGHVRISGKEVDRRSPGSALRDGVMLLSGERARESVFSVLGVRTNATAQVLRSLRRWGLVAKRDEIRAATDTVQSLKIRTPSLEQPVRFLSGGNQQKVVVGRSFLGDVRLLVMQEPTQGVDVRSRFEIYAALRVRADAGTAMLVQSSDPIELAGVCDRVVVMSRGRITDELVGDELSEARIVESIVRAQGPITESSAPGGAPRPPSPSRSGRMWGPVATLLGLMVLIGAYATSQSSSFAGSYNLGTILQLTVPLAFVSMGQLHALLLGEFDVSVGALMGFGVVVASFWLSRPSVGTVLLGAVALLVVAVAVGFANAALVRVLAIPSIIATIATLSVLQGAALMLRPTPGGSINPDFMSFATASVGFVPYSFVGVVVLAVGLDFWLYRTKDGLRTRAMGFDEVAAGRVGTSIGRRFVRAFVLSAAFAGVGALFLGALVGVGDARLGATFTLPSIAAAVLGGAALSGGRGSFLGAVNGALFFTLILNVLPFLGWSSSWGDVSRGAVTLLALLLFQRRGLLARTAGLGSSVAGRLRAKRHRGVPR